MVKLWKKAVSFALVMGLVLSMGMVSSASPNAGSVGGKNSPNAGSVGGKNSPSADTVKVGAVGLLGSSNGSISINASLAKYSTVLKALNTEAGLKKILGNYYKEGTALEVVGGPIKVEGVAPVTVEFAVEKVAKGDTIYVLHYDSEKKDWEVIIPNAVGDQYVSATFGSLSPVAFVKAARLSGEGNNDGKSPKTGEF